MAGYGVWLGTGYGWVWGMAERGADLASWFSAPDNDAENEHASKHERWQQPRLILKHVPHGLHAG